MTDNTDATMDLTADEAHLILDCLIHADQTSHHILRRGSTEHPRHNEHPERWTTYPSVFDKMYRILGLQGDSEHEVGHG